MKDYTQNGVNGLLELADLQLSEAGETGIRIATKRFGKPLRELSDEELRLGCNEAASKCYRSWWMITGYCPPEYSAFTAESNRRQAIRNGEIEGVSSRKKDHASAENLKRDLITLLKVLPTVEGSGKERLVLEEIEAIKEEIDGRRR